MKPLIYPRDPALYTLPRGLKAVVDQFSRSCRRSCRTIIGRQSMAGGGVPARRL
ncbi:hypothetical protein [Streptosporangium sp. OZ121]|uniref:hypothetical protein n=1 Tax=Streptosporangium sp. OZ121 TaxID=3444183 RepID=UPI003F79CAD7